MTNDRLWGYTITLFTQKRTGWNHIKRKDHHERIGVRHPFWQAETEKHHIIIGQSSQYPDQDLTQFLPNVRTTSEVFEEQEKLQKHE